MGTLEREKITKAEIKEAISRSGYLIEQRIMEILSRDYFVDMNHAYLDPVSNKTREIDTKVDSTPAWSDEFLSGGLHWSIFCECENNMQPVVFFPFEPLVPSAASTYIQCYGIPMKIWKDDEYVNLFSFLPFHKFHHYCKGSVATQYCSFDKRHDKDKWIATHLEEQHDTFNKLIYAVEDEIDRFYSQDWAPPQDDKVEPIFMVFIYPLIVLGGELLEAHIGRRGLITKKVKHMQFLKSLHISGREVYYKIDVITEDYLSEYMAMINYEMTKLKNMIKRHKKIIAQSVDRIIKDAKKTKKVKSYRELLTIEE